MGSLRIIWFIFSVVSLSVSFAAAGGGNDSLLNRLDRLIPDRQSFSEERKERIAACFSQLESVANDGDRYAVLRTLYGLYRGYRIDSAMIVADMRLQAARRTGDPGKMASASINLAETYANSLAPADAIAILDTINRTSMADYHIKYLYGIYYKAATNLASTALLDRDKLRYHDMAVRYRDSLLALSPDSGLTKGAYTLKAEKFAAAGLYPEAVGVIKEACRKFDLSNDAPMLHSIGILLRDAGEKDAACEALARSAILDLTEGRKEYASMIALAGLMFEQGDLHRAFEYINCALEDASFAHARLRSAEVMDIMPIIDSAFHDSEMEKSKETRRYMYLAFALGAMFAVALLIVAVQLRRTRRIKRRLDRANATLVEQNRRLCEDDALKLKFISDLLAVCGEHIESLRSYRKSVFRLMKTGQIDAAAESLGSDRLETSQLKGFYATFDKVFLSMFPEFPDKVNSMMSRPFVARSGNTMPPELRVVALMALGIDDTSRIASMLHYTAQTVYNYRSAIRSALIVDSDTFKRRLHGLIHYSSEST